MERSMHALAAIAVVGISLAGVSSAMALTEERSETEARVLARTAAIDGARDHKVVAVAPKKVVVARVVSSKPAAPKVAIAKVAAPKEIVQPKVIVEPKIVAAPKVVVEPKVIETPKAVAEPKAVESPKAITPKAQVVSLPKEAAAAFVTPAKVVMAPEIDPASAASGLTLLLGSVLVALGRRRQREILG